VTNEPLATKKQFSGLMHELAEAPTSGAPSGRLGAQTCRSRAIVAVLVRDLGRPQRPRRENRPSDVLLNPALRSSSSLAGFSTSRSPGSAAPPRIRSSGNSFATAAHEAGSCTLIMAKHPELTPFPAESVLY